MENKKERFILLDILKIIFAILIFFRHLVTMGGCSFGQFNQLIKNDTSIIMSGFFILSGFSLYYIYSNNNLKDIKNTFDFYKKRLLSIMLIYWLVDFIYRVFFSNNLSSNIKLLPIELTGMHTFFNNTFNLAHNGTTWFVSCLLLSYFIYPHIQEIIKVLSKKTKIIIFILFLLVLSYFPYMFNTFGISNTYSNPLFRNLEFTLGILLCSILNFSKKQNIKFMNNFLCSLIFIVFTFILLFSPSINNYYKYYIYIIICIIIYFASMYKTKKEKHIIITYFSNISYPFYVLQVFLWQPMVKGILLKVSNNYLRIFTFLIVLIILSTIVHYLYKIPLAKFLKKKIGSMSIAGANKNKK